MLFIHPPTLTLSLVLLVSAFSASFPFPLIVPPESRIVWGHPTHKGNSPPIPVSLPALLEQADEYHRQVIMVRGVIKQPELHLDDTHLRFNFVFRLTKGTSFIIVFGTYDRTQGPPPIALDNQVEVVGVFFKERELNASTVLNTLEAISVTPYPPVEPDRA